MSYDRLHEANEPLVEDRYVTTNVNRRAVLIGGVAAGAVLASPTIVEASARVPSERTDTTIKTSDGRNVRVSHWRAVSPTKAAILFSHGALSAPEKYERVISVWNSAGFDGIGPLHSDSTDHPDHNKLKPGESWKFRLLDMRAVADSAQVSDYIAAGHSYGGLVALTLGGAGAEIPAGFSSTSNEHVSLRDGRAKAVVAMSPPGVMPTLIALEGFRALAVPAFIQTGDRDVLHFGDREVPWPAHLTAYEQAPAGDKYSLVLEGVDHYFGGLICDSNAPGPPQPAQLIVAVALSTAFMQAYALNDPTARTLLEQSLRDTGLVRLARK